VIWISVGPDLVEGTGGGGALGRGDEAHFIEEICTQGLYSCSLTAVGIKIGGCKEEGIGPLS
jgi:hypothetical protein